MKIHPYVISSALLLVLGIAAVLTIISVGLLVEAILDWRSLLYFPGDPPTAEMMAIPSLLGLVLCAIGLAANHVRTLARNEARFVRLGSLAVLIPLALCLLVSSGSLVYRRFSPAWMDVRKGIREVGDAVLVASGGNKKRILARSEFVSLKNQFIPSPIEVRLDGFGIVHLRMAHADYPYVGVDFGEGRNALFDPDTMLCTYSD
jgi:hypothetical protein